MAKKKTIKEQISELKDKIAEIREAERNKRNELLGATEGDASKVDITKVERLRIEVEEIISQREELRAELGALEVQQQIHQLISDRIRVYLPVAKHLVTENKGVALELTAMLTELASEALKGSKSGMIEIYKTLAEMTFAYYQALTKAGFSRSEAMSIVLASKTHNIVTDVLKVASSSSSTRRS